MFPAWNKLLTETKVAISAALVCAVLFIQLLAASPILHLDVHDDAASHNHECAVKTFSQGKLDLTPPSQVFSAPVVWFEAVTPTADVQGEKHLHVVSSPRGPPSIA